MTIPDLSSIHGIDTTNQYEVLRALPRHIHEGFEIGTRASLEGIIRDAIRNIVICGMGGSAIGGDILRTLAIPVAHVPIQVVRDYSIPAWVDASSLVFIMSYSGTTEETRSAFRHARMSGAQIVAVTSGGEFAANVLNAGCQVVRIPGGLAPRAAIGHLFFGLLGAAVQLGIMDTANQQVEDLCELTTRLIESYSDPAGMQNDALQTAGRLQNRLPVIYSSTRNEAANLRWRCQIEENAKSLAYGHVFSELNHNEIVGWEQQPDLLQRIAVIMFRDDDDLKQIKVRMNITRDMIAPLAGDMIEVQAVGSSHLERLFSLICLGDWVSYWLAIITGVDPFPIFKINKLKKALADLQ
jgi:glucose/mannose-6-phosphate isomerase